MRATLFETLRLYAPDGQPVDPGSPTARSLIAYLLINRGRPVDRRRLAFTFWPGTTETAARRNLRQYLHHIRTSLESINSDETLLLTESSSIQFNPQIEISLDVEAFLNKTRPDASAEEIKHALSLYTGDLLEDIYDEWCIPERERLRQAWLETLDRYSQILQGTGKLNEALGIIQKWVAAEPFDENAQRRLMSIYALTGERAKAIQAYHAFAQSLALELDTEPLPETQILLQSIQNGHAIVEDKASLTFQQQRPLVREKPQKFQDLPFIGRQSEISSLEKVYGEAAVGSGKLILVTGEAGIGKTRLLQEYLNLHPDTAVLQSACYELDSMVPFAPLRQALQTSPLLYNLAKSAPPPTWATALIPLLPELSNQAPYTNFPSHQVDGVAMREALVNLILRLSETGQNPPLQLILDDLHWADTPTWEMLASLTRRVASAPLLIIGLFRFEDLPSERQALLRAIQRSDSHLTLDLPRLTSNETAALARHLNPKDGSNSIFVQRLFQETEGNPFFIVETVRALQETGGLQIPLPVASIPNSIQRVIEARLDRLGADSREALACAASIGRSFTYPLLQEILGDDSENIIDYIEEWLKRGLVDEGKQGYDFRHDKFRQVTYAGLSRARREYIHGRIANVLEHAIPTADVTTLAHHFSRSDQPLKALPFLAQAGEQALRLRSYHEARQFGLQAVNLLGQLPGPRQRSERIDINLQLAQAYAFTGNMQRAIEILNETEHMAVLLGDETRLGQIFRRAAQFFWLRGQPETASDYARRTLRVAEELGDTELLFASLRMLGRVSIALAAFDDAVAYLLRYVNMHDEIIETDPRIRPPEDLPIVLGYLGVAYSRVGAWERAISVSERGLSMAEAGSGGNLDATMIFARMQLAMVLAGIRNWDECIDILSTIPEAPDTDELTPPLYMVLSLRGYALAQSGDASKGIRLIQSAVNWAERVGHRVFHYLPRLFLAESLLLAGKIQPALREVKIAFAETQQSGNRWALGIALKLKADIASRLPTPHWTQIESDLIESMQLLRQIRARPDLARTYLSLRRLYDRAGQIAWAVDCHFRATTIFDELSMENELRFARGQAARERKGAVVIPNLPLRGPNVAMEEIEREEKNSE